MSTVSSGRRGEKYAAEYLRKKGLKIIKQNFRTQHGEVDIICKSGEVFVFVEVKSWKTYDVSMLEYSINKKKQERIINTAHIFLQDYPEETKARFDVVYVCGNSATHIESAFEI